MSRLLVLLPSVPSPLDTGAKIRNHGLLRALREEHKVDAVAFGHSAQHAHLASQVCRAAVVDQPPARPAMRRVLDVARSDLPDMAQRLHSAKFWRTVRCMLREQRYDAVQAEGIEMAGYLSVVPPAKRIYDAHNAEFVLQRRAASMGDSLVARIYSQIQWRRLERFERRVVRGARMTLAVSHHDANQLIALAGGGCVRVVPNAIDVAGYPFVPPPPETPRTVLFLGKMDFRPNAEGLRWFLSDVFAQLTGPEAVRVFAVGAAPPRWLVAAGQHDSRIAVTGYVPDERPYIRRCAALVLPLRAGGGSRLKALVAMASGLPVISTRFGMEGLDAEPDTHFLAAETAAEWVMSLKRLFGDPPVRRRLADNARALVQQRYDWSAIQPEIDAAYAWLHA